MFYNYFRNAVRLRACAQHYTRDHPCLHSEYLLSRVESSAHALTFCVRKSNCILCLQSSARTPNSTTHSSLVFTRVGGIAPLSSNTPSNAPEPARCHLPLSGPETPYPKIPRSSSTALTLGDLVPESVGCSYSLHPGYHSLEDIRLHLIQHHLPHD